MHPLPTLVACGCLCLPVTALAAPAQSAPETTQQTPQEYRDLWMRFFALMNTVKDKQSADKAAAEIRKLTHITNKMPSPANNGETHLRQGYELKKRLLAYQYYLSDELETVMCDPDTPFHTVVRADMGGILFMEWNPPPQKTDSDHRSIRPEAKLIVQQYNKIGDTFDTIRDKKSADQAAAAILGTCWHIADLHQQLGRLSPQEFAWTYWNSQEAETRIRTSISQIIDASFYHSDHLFTLLIHEENPINDRLHTRDINFYMLDLLGQEETGTSYSSITRHLAEISRQRHTQLLAQPNSPYAGGMGFTKETAVVIKVNSTQSDQLACLFAKKIYPTTNPVTTYLPANSSGNFILILDITAEVTERTGQYPGKRICIPLHFRTEPRAELRNEP